MHVEHTCTHPNWASVFARGRTVSACIQKACVELSVRSITSPWDLVGLCRWLRWSVNQDFWQSEHMRMKEYSIPTWVCICIVACLDILLICAYDSELYHKMVCLRLLFLRRCTVNYTDFFEAKTSFFPENQKGLVCLQFCFLWGSQLTFREEGLACN